YDEVISLLKKILEESRICKVFHDSRRDSSALHTFWHVCPTHVFDISGVSMFIENLKIYSTFEDQLIIKRAKEIAGQPIEYEGTYMKFKDFFDTAGEVLKLVEDVKAPSLNHVLEEYGAGHGLNNLKEFMKRR